jgi:hypothetical protein
MASAKSQVTTFIKRFSPTVAREFRAARAHVRKLFPKGFELVYDNYNGFGCGYSTTKLNSGVLISVVAYPRWVTLFFFHGKYLADPDGLLQGSGAQVRSIRLQPISLIQSKAVNALLRQVIEQFTVDLSTAPAMSTSIKSIVKKQLSRRPASKSVRKAPAAVRGSRAA